MNVKRVTVAYQPRRWRCQEWMWRLRGTLAGAGRALSLFLGLPQIEPALPVRIIYYKIRPLVIFALYGYNLKRRRVKNERSIAFFRPYKPSQYFLNKMRNSQPTEGPSSPLSASPATLRYSPVSTRMQFGAEPSSRYGQGIPGPRLSDRPWPSSVSSQCLAPTCSGVIQYMWCIQSAHRRKDDNPGVTSEWSDFT